MNDKERIPKVLEICHDPAAYKAAQKKAAVALKAGANIEWPTDGCAANLSILLREAGIDVPVTLGAGKIARLLGIHSGGRGWNEISPGNQQPGDVGVTFDNDPSIPGADHVYLVVERIDSDEMIIADNQEPTLHKRFASGKGKTPTDYFLRALEPIPDVIHSPINNDLASNLLQLLGIAPPVGAMHVLAQPNHLAAGGSGIQLILDLAANSEIMPYQWHQRGAAPKGYIKGMAMAFARAHCKLSAADPIVEEMCRPVSSTGKDALLHYQQIFAAAEMPADTAEERLRQIFVLLLGLGMRESSGRWCEGRDRSTTNTTAETAEAGLFQASWNARKYNQLLPELTNSYAGREDFLDIFKEGVTPKEKDLENFGSGSGRDFQRLTKYCPAFAIEFAGIGLRNRFDGWGPVMRKEVEIKRKADSLFRLVAQEVQANSLCPL